MKKVFALMVALILINSAKGQWYQNYCDTTIDLRSIFFPTHQIGYAVGSKIDSNGYHYAGVILKTFNQGESWIMQDSIEAWPLNSVYFLNPDTGYVMGSIFYSPPGASIILKTTNGGASWDTMLIRGGILSSIFFTDVTTGYAVGEGGAYPLPNRLILKTTDGGSNWTMQINDAPGTGFFKSVFFLDSINGYAVGGKIVNGSLGFVYKTTNGGSNWQNIFEVGYDVFNSVYFTTNSTGYVVSSSGKIFKTSEAGVTWNQTEITDNGLSSVYFTDENTGYITVYPSWNFIDHYIYKTCNAGQTWFYQLIDSPDSLCEMVSVYFPGTDTGFAVGSKFIPSNSTCRGCIFKTHNGGGFSVGKNEISINDFLKFYPNPVSSTITVSGKTIGDLLIYDIKGQQFLNIRGASLPKTIKVNSLPHGIYFIKFISNDGVKVNKFMKE